MVGELIECFFSSLLGIFKLFTDVSFEYLQTYNFLLQKNIYNHHLLLRMSWYRFRAIEECLMHIKYIKNGLKTSRYACSPKWDVLWGAPWQWDIPWDAPIGQIEKLAFCFYLRVLRVVPHGSSHYVP